MPASREKEDELGTCRGETSIIVGKNVVSEYLEGSIPSLQTLTRERIEITAY